MAAQRILPEHVESGLQQPAEGRIKLGSDKSDIPQLHVPVIEAEFVSVGAGVLPWSCHVLVTVIANVGRYKIYKVADFQSFAGLCIMRFA